MKYGVDNYFPLILYWPCDYLSMLVISMLVKGVPGVDCIGETCLSRGRVSSNRAMSGSRNVRTPE